MWIHDKVVQFFGVSGLMALSSAHQLNWHALLTLNGLEAAIAPIFPFAIVLEMAFLVWLNRRSTASIYAAYKIPVLMYVFNAAIAGVVNLNVFLWTQSHFAAFAPFTAPLRIRWFIYAYVVWEFSHFVYHWTCHKVRLLWCLHSPHHAPEHMNISVIFTAFFLQGAYATIVRTAICSFLGVPIELLFLVMVIDSCWGTLIHVSEEVWPSGKFRGVLGRLILNPAHHRVHHASNPEYLDMNYCNTLPIWDKIFGTLQHEIQGIKPVYGITRDVKNLSFTDMYFGEIWLLWKDIRNADSWKDRVLHIVMPPGWQPRSKR
ncbi:sterol desaturase family protein [Burkholderia anthina]|uniref:sterol desaturase family protein n=1 Tax=Burkholderia anthina TaxID=179879 RepID=UPI00158EFD46|nr:sterol desaturase family protein [Burkholderia anthina]